MSVSESSMECLMPGRQEKNKSGELEFKKKWGKGSRKTRFHILCRPAQGSSSLHPWCWCLSFRMSGFTNPDPVRGLKAPSSDRDLEGACGSTLIHAHNTMPFATVPTIQFYLFFSKSEIKGGNSSTFLHLSFWIQDVCRMSLFNRAPCLIEMSDGPFCLQLP